MAAQKINSKKQEELDIQYDIAKNLRKGGVVILREKFPCKVVELNWAQPGKHGSAKIRVVGLDIFTDKKYDDIFGSDEQVTVPNVAKTDYQFQFLMEDGYVKLLKLANSVVRDDIRIKDEDLTDKIVDLSASTEDDEMVVVTVLSAMGFEKVIAAKVEKMKKLKN